ncbi:penicillin-binding transpeptidase domain-containing protein [Clostridium sp.]|uniref:penicillin-binding transpeptidase domain-containing protein n=1 Tax=Clostridium sp. TaxID=1506 RepID=UPI003216F2F3
MFQKSFKRQITARNYCLLSIMLLMFIGLIIRFIHVQLMEGPTLLVSANEQYYYEEDINNINFKLLDRNNNNLFESTLKYYAVIDPLTFYTLNEEATFISMKNVSYILRSFKKDYDISSLQYEMEHGNKQYEIDKECYEKLKNIEDVKGMYVYEYTEYKKNNDWNIKNIIASGVKYSDNSKLKDEGTLEREIYEYTKDNKKEQLKLEKDVSGNIINEVFSDIKCNNNVVTTLDYNIQRKIEEILKSKNYEEYGQIGAVLMESSTGDILSMAQKNDSLSNVNIGIPSGNGFLLGSTFKTIVYEAALENQLIGIDEKFYLKGIFPKSIEKLGSYNMEQAYIASSNDTFAQIGWKVGMDRIYELSNRLGLFNKTLNLQDEKSGTIEGYKVENNLDIITNTSIGQTVRGTPIAVLSIPNTVVNGGKYIKPKIIKEIVSEEGKTLKKYESESREVFSESTANIIKAGMIGVVNDDLGTGSNAKIDNIEVGGKTGTTEYFEGDKKCSDGWFAGFLKYDNKYYSMVIYLPQIEEKSGSSQVACSIFKDIIENLIQGNYMQLN